MHRFNYIVKVILFTMQARHGTRAPTKKRIKELDQLGIRLDSLLSEAKQGPLGSPIQTIPSWLSDWKSPWKGRNKGGELVTEGENELYQLGIRVWERFPELFKEEYHPDIFTIRATQVSLSTYDTRRLMDVHKHVGMFLMNISHDSLEVHIYLLYEQP